MIPRTGIIETLHTALARSRVVVLTGPRQCGKTTLARELLSEDSANYFDLEDPSQGNLGVGGTQGSRLHFSPRSRAMKEGGRG